MVDICSEKASEVDRIRPKNEHSIADRYFFNPSGAPKSAGGRPGEAFGANPREGWLRRGAGEGAPGRPGEALGAKIIMVGF